MPLTLRPREMLLDAILSSILAGNVVSDINQISVIRQLCEGVAATQADLDYDLYSLLQGFYLTSAEGIDLDLRGRDFGLSRDPGQPASDPVTFSKDPLWIDDIALVAPMVVQATLADGTTVLYRSVGDTAILCSGRSISGAAPATSITSGVNDRIAVNLDGDGARTLILGTQGTGTAIAAAIQAAVRALVPNNAIHQAAYTNFRCDYNVTTAGAYTLRTGTAGTASSVVVTAPGTNNGTVVLKLGVANGGTEQAGQGSVEVPVICDTIGVLGNVSAGQINQLISTVPGIVSVANALAFANGREPASDDAYRQDVRSYILSLGPGTQDAVERAVLQTVSADGQKHVMSAQVVYGAGTIAAYICDGRSLTVGAQQDVIEDVQDELDGLGQRVGGWVPAGNAAGVVPATILTVHVDVDVFVGPTPDLVSAQSALVNALYRFLFTADVGQVITATLMDGVIDQTVVEVYNIVYRLPTVFTLTPRGTVGGAIGVKPMPGTLTVHVYRA